VALTRKNLAFGQLPAAKGDLYVAPGDTKGFVHNILVHNIGGVAEIVDLYYHDGVSEFLIFKMTISSNETVLVDFIGEGFVVEATKKITGNTTTAATVTYKIDGTEES